MLNDIVFAGQNILKPAQGLDLGYAFFSDKGRRAGPRRQWA